MQRHTNPFHRHATSSPRRRDVGVPVAARQAAVVIAIAVAAALVLWEIIRRVGVDLVADRGGVATPVRATDVVVAALVFGLLAWGVQGLLRRRGVATWWPFTGSTALSVSMIGPSSQADGAAAMALMALHLVVGAILIAGFHLAGTTHRGAVTTTNRVGA